ncbi:MAG: MarR family winged helix-turn-helix transcriptional regulator [Actinomycetota bacterium]
MAEGTGHALRRLLGPLRRAVARVVPTPENAASLSDAQVELLRALEHGGPLTTTEVAARLHISRPTVSNLVKALHQQGLINRELAPGDFRSTLISLSPQARRELARSDGKRAATFQRTIDRLPPEDRAAISRAIPALEHLLAMLREDADRAADP